MFEDLFRFDIMGRNNTALQQKLRVPNGLLSTTSLMTVVEAVPAGAGTAPVIVRCGVVGAEVGVLRLLVQSTSLDALNESLGVQIGRLLAVEDGAEKRRRHRPSQPRHSLPVHRAPATAPRPEQNPAAWFERPLANSAVSSTLRT